MRFSTKFLLGAAILLLNVPLAAAKFYPDDFIPWGQEGSFVPGSSQSVEAPAPTPVTTPEPSQAFFFASEIPAGKLTRAQLVDAIATRLYTADIHDECFADLILSNTVNYELLYNDVSLDAAYASSICLSMRNGIAQGYSDGNFRPNKQITVAEAAAVLTQLGGTPLRDSNHVKKGEVWYERYMDAMRAVDREFTMRPWDIMTGAQLRHSLCVLKRMTPTLDPLGEFTGC